MKKIILTSVIACLLFTTGVFASNMYRDFIAQEIDYTIEINGKQQDFELPVVSIEDSTYVALRQLCEKIGYKVEWIEEERRIKLSNNDKSLLLFYEDMSKSQEGILSNGIKFNYIAKDDFSYQEQIKQWGVISSRGNYGEVPTAKIAAEIGKALLGYDSKNIIDVTIQVYFDSEKDAWFVYGLSNGTSHSGLRVVVIQRSDGKIIDKYELR